MKTVAKAFIFDAAGNVLLLHRSATHPSYAHQPDLPGGIIETGETPPIGLAREILEETGLVVEPKDLELLAETDQRVYNHDQIYRVAVQGVKPAVDISWEHERPMWLSSDALLQQPLKDSFDSYYVFALEALYKRHT